MNVLHKMRCIMAWPLRMQGTSFWIYLISGSPCIELTFESLESQAKQDHGAPHRVRNRRACTCKSLFFTLLLDGAACFRFLPTALALSWQILVWEVSWGSALSPSPCTTEICRAVLFVLPRLRECSIRAPGYQGLYFINHLNPFAFFSADQQGTEEFGFLWILSHSGNPEVL